LDYERELLQPTNSLADVLGRLFALPQPTLIIINLLFTDLMQPCSHALHSMRDIKIVLDPAMAVAAVIS
jgi:hypothetical protein